MTHSESDSGWTIGIRAQSFLVEGQSSAVVLLVEGNASFSEQRRNVGWRLVQNEIELCIGLFHFIPLEQTKVCPTQKMVLESKKR